MYITLSNQLHTSVLQTHCICQFTEKVQIGKSECSKGFAVSLLSHFWLVTGSSFASGNVLGKACVKFQHIGYVSQNVGFCDCLLDAGLKMFKILHTT